MLDRRWILGIVGLALLAVVASAIGLYVMGSSRIEPGRVPSVERAATGAPGKGPGAAAAPAPSIDVLAERLAQRLKDSDGTADDWALLARSYVQMQRYPEAVDAFGKALQKMPDNQAFKDEQAAARKAAAGSTPPKK
jgi:cytochrome c-type biogenesis protein CcmH/NrfG